MKKSRSIFIHFVPTILLLIPCFFPSLCLVVPRGCTQGKGVTLRCWGTLGCPWLQQHFGSTMTYFTAPVGHEQLPNNSSTEVTEQLSRAETIVNV